MDDSDNIDLSDLLDDDKEDKKSEKSSPKLPQKKEERTFLFFLNNAQKKNVEDIKEEPNNFPPNLNSNNENLNSKNKIDNQKKTFLELSDEALANINQPKPQPKPKPITKNNTQNINPPKMIPQNIPINNESSNQNNFKKSEPLKITPRLQLPDTSNNADSSYSMKVDEKILNDEIEKLKNMTKLIVSEYSKIIEETEQKYKDMEYYYKLELQIITSQYDKKIDDQKKKNEEDFNKIKEKINDDKNKEITEIKKRLESNYKQEILILDNKYKREIDFIESNNKLDLEKLDKDIEEIRESNKALRSQINSNFEMEELFKDLNRKLSKNNSNIELKIKLKENEILKQELDLKSKNLSNILDQVKENIEQCKIEKFNNKEELQNIKKQYEEQIKLLHSKENDINKINYERKKNSELNKINLDRKINEIEEDEENFQKEMENKENELQKKKNLLEEEKELMEKEKKEFLEMIEEKKKDLAQKNENLKEIEADIENKIKELNNNEIYIMNAFNSTQNLKENISSERNEIFKDQYEMQILEQKIQNEIEQLNKDRHSIELEKEKIKNEYRKIEQENANLENQEKELELENAGLNLRNENIDNMRLNYVLNDNYVNKNNDKNENDIKYNTSPITLRDFNKKKIPEKKKDFGSTVSLFNEGGKKISVDEYFDRLNMEMKKKTSDSGYKMEEDFNMQNYLENGRKFIKDTKEELSNELNDIDNV